jgi:hypothetical protein
LHSKGSVVRLEYMKYHTAFLVVFSLLLGLADLSAQSGNVWNTLTLMKFEGQYSQNDGIGSQGGGQSRFRPLIEKLHGTEIEVKGYIIPLTGERAQSTFMFSAYPYDMCFFCGKAGPESVMEVEMAGGEKVAYSDRAIWVKGTFHFNPNAESGIWYSLKEAESIEK